MSSTVFTPRSASASSFAIAVANVPVFLPPGALKLATCSS